MQRDFDSAPASAPVVTLWSGYSFTGNKQDFGIGSFDTSTLLQGIGNDAAYSIQVPDGLTAILCDDAGFQGLRVPVTGNVATLASFGGRVSSLFVVPTPVLISAIDEGQYYNIRIKGAIVPSYLTLYGGEEDCFMDLAGYSIGCDPTTPRSQFRFVSIGVGDDGGTAYRIVCRQTGGDIWVAPFPVQYRFGDTPDLAKQGWCVFWRDPKGAPGAASLTPATGLFTTYGIGLYPNQIVRGSTVMQAALGAAPGEWEIVPVMQTCFPGFSAISTDALKKTTTDYAIEAGFKLAGSLADALKVPGGSALMTGLYQAAFPAADMSKILGQLAAELLNSTFVAIAGNDVVKAQADLRTHQEWFANTYVTNRNVDIKNNTVANSAAALLTYANSTVPVSMNEIDGGVTFVNGVWTCAGDANIALNKCLSGFATYVSLAVLRWAMLKERVLLVACTQGDAKSAMQSLADAMAADAKVLNNALGFVVAWRTSNVQGSFKTSQSWGSEGNNSYQFTTDTLNITELSAPNQTRTALQVSEDNDSRNNKSDPFTVLDVQRWTTHYCTELSWDYNNVRFRQISCASTTSQQNILTAAANEVTACADATQRATFLTAMSNQSPTSLYPPSALARA